MVLHEAQPRRAREGLSRSVSVAVGLAVLAEEAMRKSASLVLSPDVASPLSPLCIARPLCTQTRMKRIARRRRRREGKRAHISNLQSNIIRRPPVGSLPPSCSPLPTCKNDTMDTREAEKERDQHPPRLRSADCIIHSNFNLHKKRIRPPDSFAFFAAAPHCV